MADAGKTGAPPRRRIRNFMLNPGVQLPYVASVGAVTMLLTAILGYLLWSEASAATDQVVRSAQEAYGAAIEDEVRAVLSRDDRMLVWLIIGAGLALTAVLVAYVVVMTHHVAGPLFKVGAYFDRLRDGKLPQVRDLRKGDKLEGFYGKFRAMEDALVERTERDARLIDGFLAAWDEARVPGDVPPDVEARVAQLRALSVRKHQSLNNRPARLFTVPGPPPA